MQRHRDLSLRKPENTSLSRSMAFNRPVVNDFFEKYTSVLEKYQFIAGEIWNLDETGLSTVMPSTRVVATKGKKQIGQITSQERGELVTFVGIINASGNSVPPVFVYPRLRNPEEYMGEEYPTSALALGNRSGWMTSELFPKVISHFVKHVKCSTERKVLLLLDNHESHISVETISLCRQNGIILLSFPPHTTHRMQPLDVGVFGPFKSFLARAQNDWFLNNPARALTIRHIARLAAKAFENAFTMKNITSSFKSTGLWPVDCGIFKEEAFLPSTVTDKPLLDERNSSVVETQENREPELARPAIPLQEGLVEEQPRTCSPSPGPSGCKLPRPEDIRPYPKADRENKKNTNRKKAKSTIYTNTPEFETRKSLELEKTRKKDVKKSKTVKRNLLRQDSESSIEIPQNDTSSEDESSGEDITYISEEHPISLDSFVLIKFISKSSKIYYIGKVIAIENNEFEVQFLRRKGVSNRFIFPNIVDCSVIERKDIVAILKCNNQKGTARTCSVYQFNFNFCGINVR